ncbi:MAG TPA: hypothetical protein VEW72_10770, partial [Burkholderiales bacterium]|nr:hypothetical protein [Burkholderiales bacterium]
MRTAIAWAWLALVACLSAGPTGAQELPAMPIDKPRPSGPPPNATIEQPRPFGHVVGDVLTQRILLQLDGRPFSPAPLPRPERVSNWLERRELRIVAADDGRRWLEAEFQIINAPTSLTPTVIPAWELPSASGQSALRMPEWPISIAPLIPQTAAGEDVRSGSALLEPGMLLTPQRLALLAAQGLAEIETVRRACIGPLSTGSELREPGERLGPGQIYNSNRIIIRSILASEPWA